MDRATPKRMPRDNFFKLCLWVQSQSERLAREMPMLESLADQAKKELGFEVTKQQARDAKRTTGQTWKSTHPETDVKRKNSLLFMAKLEKIENAIRFLCRRSGLDYEKLP